MLGTGQGPEARAPGNAVWPLIPAGVPAGREWEDRNRAGTEATTGVPGGAGAVPVGTLLRAPSSEDMAQSPASCVAQSYIGGCERTHNAPTKQLPVTPGVGTVGAGDRLAATSALRHCVRLHRLHLPYWAERPGWLPAPSGREDSVTGNTRARTSAHVTGARRPRGAASAQPPTHVLAATCSCRARCPRSLSTQLDTVLAAWERTRSQVPNS